jgi:hypothetical protein
MFEKTILRRSESGGALTLGEIAEAMLFYRRVHVIVDYGLLSQILDLIGMEGLFELLDRNVSATYCPESLGTTTTKIGAIDHHSFIGFQYAGDQEAPNLHRHQDVLEHLLAKRGYEKTKARRLSVLFLEKVPVKKITEEKFVREGVCKAATTELYDNAFLVEAIKATLSHTEGAFQKGDLKVEIIPTHLGFHALSNINFDAINLMRSQSAPALEPLTLAHILQNIFEARVDTALAAHYGGDFQTSRIASAVIAIRSGDLMHRAGLNRDQLSLFQDIVVDGGRSVSEVIDSGERKFSEFLKLIDHSKRFQHWVGQVHPDQSVVTAYLTELSREGWIESLPAKAIRYSMCTIADAIEPIVLGKATSVVDAFVLDKLLKGWRPNHFVRKRLKPFVEGG